MDIDFCVKTFVEKYNEFIEQISFLFATQEYKSLLLKLNNETKDKKWIKGVRFQQKLTDEYFDLFIESKIKLFSHKEEPTKMLSESLFGEDLSLKKIFNNRDDNTKFVLWSYLHVMVLMVELAQKKKNKERVNKLKDLLDKNSEKLEKCKTKINQQNSQPKDPKEMIKEMFKVDLNDQTNEMLTDIVKSFEKSLSGANSNPLSGILEISQKITSKYQEKINNGEIELNKLVEGIQKSVPGMEEIMKNGMGGMMSDVMGSVMGGENKPKETVIIDENFSTANVELGKQNETKGGFNIGKMLNLADSFGVLPSLGGEEDGKSTMDPNMAELFSMMSNIGDMNKEEDMNAFKNKIDGFLSKQGIDINKLNNDIEAMIENSKGKLESIEDNKETAENQ